MDKIINLILDNQIYLVLMASIMIIWKIFAEKEVALSFLKKIRVKNKRLNLALLYSISWILPLPGRVVATAPLLSSMTNNSQESKSRLGVMNYVIAHHYYLWSPIEESVVIILAATWISYLWFLQMTLPFLITYFAFTLWMLFKYVKDEDLEWMKTSIYPKWNPYSAWMVLPFVIGIVQFVYFSWDDGVWLDVVWGTWVFSWSDFIGVSIMAIIALFYVLITKTKFSTALSYIKWKSLILLAVVIVIGNIIKSHNSDIKDFITTLSNSSVLIVCLVGWLASFAMWSSWKYAWLTALMSKVVWIQYLPIIFAFDFVGYLLAPTHKCIAMSCSYFWTSTKEMYKWLVMIGWSIIIVALVDFLFL